MGPYVFAYGTLRTGASNHIIAGLDSNTISLGIKKLKGYQMFEVPNNGMGSKDYPGIVWTGSDSDFVTGELFEIVGSDSAKAGFLKSLDNFENDAESPEYIREIIDIEGISAYCYIYLLDTSRLKLIPKGDWLSL